MDDLLAKRFEAHRDHLRKVAYRMLGSLTEADDAVQESWLRLTRAGAEGVDNLGAWLTTVVARVSLDMLRSRKIRREEPLAGQEPDPSAARPPASDPEQEAALADSVGLALLVVLDALDPPERLAFVLHDMFAVPFEEIAPIVGRTPAAARQLASRARRRVQGAPAVPEADLTRQRDVVGAFLAALRGGDMQALLSVLDPAVVIHADEASLPPGEPKEIHGAPEVARRALALSRGARTARPALVDGAVGIVVAPQGRLFRVLRFTLRDGKIARIDVVGDEASLRQVEVAVLDP